MIARAPLIEIEVAKLNSEGEATEETETFSVPLNIGLAERLERKFGDLQKLIDECQKRPVLATIKIMETVTGWREPEIRQRLLPGSVQRIAQQVLVAYGRFLGVEMPEEVGGPLAAGDITSPAQSTGISGSASG